MLHIAVPKSEEAPWTLFAAGKVKNRLMSETHHIFVFDNRSVVFVYYYFPHRRRVYMVIEPGLNRFREVIRLPNVKTPVSCLAVFEGREFDQVKNTVYGLGQEDPDFYLKPPGFFVRLACLVGSGKNSQRNIRLLEKEFSPTGVRLGETAALRS